MSRYLLSASNSVKPTLCCTRRCVFCDRWFFRSFYYLCEHMVHIARYCPQDLVPLYPLLMELEKIAKRNVFITLFQLKSMYSHKTHNYVMSYVCLFLRPRQPPTNLLLLVVYAPPSRKKFFQSRFFASGSRECVFWVKAGGNKKKIHFRRSRLSLSLRSFLRHAEENVQMSATVWS